MDKRLDTHGARGHLVYAIAQHVPTLGRKLHLQTGQLAFPGRVRRSFEHQFQLGLGLVQLLLCPLALRLMGEIVQRKIYVRCYLREQGTGIRRKAVGRSSDQHKHPYNLIRPVQRKGRSGSCVR